MEALRLYFAALREDVGYDVKYAMRDEVLALPSVPARAMDDQERATVRARIAEERDRDVVQKAVAFEGKGWLHAAHLLRSRLKALDGISTPRVEALGKELERLEKAICEHPTDVEKAEAKEIEGPPADVAGAFDRAAKAVAAGKGRSALKAYTALGYSGVATQEQKDKARALHAELWKALVAAIPEEQKVAADKVWDDPHWTYLGTSVSHQFVFIGERGFVETISPQDRIRMDLACVMLCDLVGRDLTEDGQRVTIYYKERFDFGGGIGGGKRIDIGNKAIAKPIAGTLHYHELAHCAFDVGMLYPGFVEGIANFGATFCLDALGRPDECDAAIRSNRAQWQADYLERRIRYWRIQSYGPSCGFLLLPMTEKSPVARQGEWAKVRSFFRRLRRDPIDEPRESERCRYFVWHWCKEFGFELLDKAAGGRFPLLPADRDRVRAELETWLDLARQGLAYADQSYGSAAIDPLERVIAGHPRSALADLCKFGLATVREGLGETAVRDALYKELGVVPRWKLCLPFYARDCSPLFPVFEPERSLDQSAEYPNPAQTARWRDAKVAPDGLCDLLEHGVGYPDDAAAYACIDLEVPADVMDAVVRVGFDDMLAVWIDGKMAEKWDEATGWIRDHRVAAIPLHKGRNRLLLKIANRSGAWRFSARVAHADHTPIEGLAFVDPPAKDVPPAPPEPKPHALYTLDLEKAKALPKGKVKPTVGTWEVDAKALRRTAPGNVQWRKFQIQPFVSKDPPSGLVWLVDKDLATLEDYALEVLVRLPREGAPRLAVTLNGEEKDDGLSGHTFLIQGGGEGVNVRLEEYDRLVFHGTAPIAKSAEHVLRFVRRGRTLSLLVDGALAIDRADLPALPRPGIGIMTWDKENGIGRVRLERLGGSPK